MSTALKLSRRLPLALLPLVMSFYGSASASNLIINGSFETPVVPASQFVNFLGNSTAITGWTVVGVDSSIANTHFVQSGITFNAEDGNQWIDLAGVTSNNPSSGVTQSVATTISQLYVVSFYVGSALDVTPSHFFFPTTVDLSIDGSPRAHFLNPAAPTNALDWKLFSVNFVATQTVTTLTFLNGAASNNFLTGLDNVQLSAVPLPAPVGLLALGICGLFRARRERRQA